MRTKKYLSWLGVILAVQSCFSCSSPAPDPAEPDVIPLDGRGGGVIAYCRQGPSLTEIHAVNADGSGGKRLVTRSQGLNHPDWSADGARLAMSGQVDDTTYSIFSANADGGNLLRLTHTPSVLDKEPDWSPDGTQIAFVRDYYPQQSTRRELWVMNADGGNARWIGVQGLGDTVEWSRDGSRLLFSAEVSGSWEVHVCLSSGANSMPLTQANCSAQMHPSWSPDGSRIVFVDHQAGSWALTVMNADGTLPRPLLSISRAVWMPKWAPSGALIGFTYSPDEIPDHYEIYTVNSDGNDLRRVTNTPAGSTAVDPDWRPVGR